MRSWTLMVRSAATPRVSNHLGCEIRLDPSSKWCRVERQRLDKWLWHARVVKARTSAAALVEAGHVRINGVRETAPGHAVKAGDVLTIGLDRSVRVLRIIGFAERRGDAQAARVLYDDLQATKQ